LTLRDISGIDKSCSAEQVFAERFSEEAHGKQASAVIRSDRDRQSEDVAYMAKRIVGA
jgi:hypothetical protein